MSFFVGRMLVSIVTGSDQGLFRTQGYQLEHIEHFRVQVDTEVAGHTKLHPLVAYAFRNTGVGTMKLLLVFCSTSIEEGLSRSLNTP